MPGLSPKEIIEQSSCFVFMDRMVHTYNDEISCSQSSLLKVEGAVPAIPFISILRKLEEDELDIRTNEENSQLLVKGKRRRAGIRIDSKVLLPIEEVDKPKKWKPLPADFADAVAITQPCAGSDAAKINAALGKKPKKMNQLVSEAKVSGTHYQHLNHLVESGGVVKSEKGLALA